MSILPALSATDIATMQTAGAEATLQLARVSAVGGSLWTVTRTVVGSSGGQTGNGIFGPVRGAGTPNTVTTHTATLSVFTARRNPDQIVIATAQEFLPTEQWLAKAPLPVDIQNGDHITSVSDSTLQFDVVNIVRHPGFARLDLRETH